MKYKMHVAKRIAKTVRWVLENPKRVCLLIEEAALHQEVQQLVQNYQKRSPRKQKSN